MSVEIRDSISAAPLADSATARVIDGSFTDTLGVCSLTSDYQPVSRCGAGARPKRLYAPLMPGCWTVEQAVGAPFLQLLAGGHPYVALGLATPFIASPIAALLVGGPRPALSRPSRLPSPWLAFRSLLWTLLLPGIVAGYVPWRYFGLARVRLDLGRPMVVLGLTCMAAGGMLLATCIWEFARSGRGTLAPVDPPRELVVRGLYRYVRNPMYLSVTAIVLGEGLLARSWALLLYWAVFFLAANLFVIGYEEPALRRRFGDSYEQYAQRVRRWLPRFRLAQSEVDTHP